MNRRSPTGSGRHAFPRWNKVPGVFHEGKGTGMQPSPFSGLIRKNDAGNHDLR